MDCHRTTAGMLSDFLENFHEGVLGYAEFILVIVVRKNA